MRALFISFLLIGSASIFFFAVEAIILTASSATGIPSIDSGDAP